MVLVVRLALTVIRAYRARPIAAMGTLGKDAVAVNPRVGISLPSAKWREGRGIKLWFPTSGLRPS